MSERLSKEDYIVWFRPLNKHPWLLNYEESFSELMAFCANRDEIRIVCDLLSRLTFLDYKMQATFCSEMVKKIKCEWALPISETQVVAITTGSDPDSAQVIVQMLKVAFAREGWSSVKLVNRFGKCLQTLVQHPKIVLVDEFIGSGTTILNRIKQLRSNCDKLVSEGKMSGDYEIKVCVIASLEDARAVVESEGVEIHAELWLKKGITQHYIGRALRKACKCMLRMESRLLWNERDEEFPFGYKRSEALFAVQDGNASNNLFPVFWWERLKNGKIRKPLFIRKEHGIRWLR